MRVQEQKYQVRSGLDLFMLSLKYLRARGVQSLIHQKAGNTSTLTRQLEAD